MADSELDRLQLNRCEKCEARDDRKLCISCVSNALVINRLKQIAIEAGSASAVRPSWDVSDQWEDHYANGGKIKCVVETDYGSLISLPKNDSWCLHCANGVCIERSQFNLIPKPKSPPAPAPRLLTPGELPFEVMVKNEHGQIFLIGPDSFCLEDHEWNSMRWLPCDHNMTLNQYRKRTDWREFTTTKPLPEGD